MTTIGDVVTKLTVDKRSFEKGLVGAGRDVRRFVGTMDSAGGSSRKATMALLELSRGAEDAASQFGTQGLAGALRGSMNNLSAMATMLNPMAGVVVGIGAAIASVLLPRLMELKTTADLAKESVGSLEDALKAVSGIRESGEREQGLEAGTIGVNEQRGRVAAARGEVADIETVIRQARLGQEMARQSGDDVLLEELTKQIDEATGRLGEARKRLATEERLLTEGVAAAENRRRREARRPGANEVWRDGVNTELLRRHNQRQKMEDLYFAPQRGKEAARQQAVANFDTFALQRSLLAGAGSRLSGLQRQREELLRGPRTSSRAPELAMRGNSIDRIIEIAQGKRDAKDETYRKTQLEKLDRQIELQERLIEAIRNDSGLKPAGIT